MTFQPEWRHDFRRLTAGARGRTPWRSRQQAVVAGGGAGRDDGIVSVAGLVVGVAAAHTTIPGSGDGCGGSVAAGALKYGGG